MLPSIARGSSLAGSARLVVDSNRPVISPIEVTGLDDVLTLYHSVDDAVTAWMPR